MIGYPRSLRRMFPTCGFHPSISLIRAMRRSFGWTILAVTISSALAQNAPTPQNIPYQQDFGTAAFSTLPSGMVAWNGLNGGTVNTLSLAEASSPTGNATVSQATSPQTAGGCYGYATGGNARFYIQSSSNATNGVNQLALAVNTLGWETVTLSYDLEIVQAETRTIGVVCQYRIGDSGAWTTLAPAAGPNPFSRSGGAPGPAETVTIQLPPAAVQQANVQIRWALWRGTEGGNSAGLAIDNISVTGTGQWMPPVGYYDSAEGLTGASLRTALQAISATGHVPLDFEDTFNPLRAIHEDPDNGNNVITVYSGTSLGKFEVFFPGGDRDPDSSWDREHLWPVSYGLNPQPGAPTRSDLFNLRPAINSVNNLRDNLYFDNSSGSVSVPALAPLCSYDIDSWEPRDSEKGDIARIMFYMATRYDGSDPGTIDLQLADTPSSPASAGRFANLSTLLSWHVADPVSEEERRIHQLTVNHQGNRNPFVDRPDFVSLLWGELLADKTTATVTEGGAGDSYTIAMTSEPFANVTVQIAGAPAGQLAVSPSSITFDSNNWNQPQTIAIEAIGGAIPEGGGIVNLNHQVLSTDPYHASQTLPPVEVTVIGSVPTIEPATLPLAYGGPWSPLPGTGFRGDGLGTPYGSSLGDDTAPGSARFDTSGASLTVAFDSSPALLTYHLRGNTGGEPATSGIFHVLESPDGQQFALVREVIDKSTADESFSDPLAPDTRFLRFVHVEKSLGNIQFDKLSITALPTLTPWEEWLSGYQLSGADAMAAADPDRDGYANLAEYALGRSPVAPDPPSSAPLTEILPGKIRITAVLRVSDPALTCTAETTTDLADPLSWTQTGVTRIVADDQSGVAEGFERTIFEIDDDGAATRFARLRFSL